MEFPVLAALTAFSISIIFVILSIRVTMVRQKKNVDFGIGDDLTLERVVRAHGNLVESAPIFLILLILLEMRVGESLVVMTLGIAYVIGRLIAMFASFAPQQILPARIVTMLVSNLSILVTGIMLIREIL